MTDDGRNEVDAYISMGEAAKYLGVSQKTIRRWRDDRELPCHVIGGVVRFRRREIDEWVKRQQVAA